MTNENTTSQTIVQPKMTYNYILDDERLVRYNLRLNNLGRKIISRHHSDNHQFLLTQFGFNWLRDMKAVNVVEVVRGQTRSFRTVVNSLACERIARDKFYSLVDLRRYDDFVSQMYAEPKAISRRSDYTAESFFKMLNKYGYNRKTTIPAPYITTMLGLLDKYMKPWIQDQNFTFDFADFIKIGKWLAHIKTHSNSGYPDNIKQDKELMTRYARQAIKLFEDYISGKPINWHKLPFEMGHRTERKDKHRVICMAPTLEKILSAVISTLLDTYAATLPFNLPRKYGGPEAQIREFARFEGNVITKDFEAYDTSIPLHLLKVLRDWFHAFGNTMAMLISFELDMIINSYMVVGPQLLFHIASLPSGIGVTQFIGSLIHWLLDMTFELQTTIAMYQSDDNMARTRMNEKEVQTVFDAMQAATGMVISPLGKKSSFHPFIGKFLQKIMILDERMVYFNHEQRAYTNGLFRERQMDDDSVFSIMFDSAKKDVDHKKMVLAYLGNLVSYGQRAPSIDNILSFMYGRRSGFSESQVSWGLTNLQRYMNVYLANEEHRAIESVGWLEGFMQKAIIKHKWTEIQPSDVNAILSSI